jgi:mercuric ion binding protein
MKLLTLIALLLPAFLLPAQSSTDTVTIRSSVVCETCKETIEHDLSFEKGVKSVHVNLDSATVIVVYQPARTSPDKIRTALTRVGYDADSLKADPKAYRKLPDCCKSPGHHAH